MKPDIRITGHQWWWQIDYLNDDPSKRFTSGKRAPPSGGPSHVHIEVVTADVMHSLWIPALHGKVDLIPGLKKSHPDFKRHSREPTRDSARNSAVRSMRTCACLQWRRSPNDFVAWKERSGSSPARASLLHKEDRRESSSFLLGTVLDVPHGARNTGGRKSRPRSHAHWAAARRSQRDSFPNNNGFLEGWITHAQSLKPDCLMPNLTQFTGPQLQDLVEYLRQLQ